MIQPKQQAPGGRSGKKGGKGAAILFSEGRRKNAASRDGSNSCVSDGSYRETPQTYF